MKHLLLLFSFFFLAMSAAAQTNGEHSFNSNGVQIHYQVVGEGEPVIMLHGYMSEHDHNWQYVSPVLEQDFKLIGVDIRGHGNSEKPHNEEAYGDELFLDVNRLMKHLEIEKAHIVGYSLGGYIALKFAAQFPDRVKTLTVAGSGLLTQKELEVMGSRLSNGLKSSDTIVDFYKSRYPADVLTEAFFEQVSTNDKVALTQLIKEVPSLYISTEEAQKITAPILAVSGEFDTALKQAAYLAEFATQTQIVKIKGEHHLSAPKVPAFSTAIRDFLKGVGK